MHGNKGDKAQALRPRRAPPKSSQRPTSLLGYAVVMRYEGYMILEHPMGIVIHFGLDSDLVPSENMTNAYLRFTTGQEAVALYSEWVDRVSDDGFIHAPGTTFYGMIEWGMTDPDANAL